MWVRDAEGKAQKKPITLGLEGLTTVEVSKGLQAEDQVLIPSPDSVLKPGIPITLQTSPEKEPVKKEK